MITSRNSGAFSLVEVIVAIGIASFCIVAILGLFSVGFQAGQQARNMAVVAGASTRLMSEIRARTTNLILPADWLLDSNGQMVTNSSSAVFRCQVTTNAIPVSEISGVGTNLVRVEMQFTWPASQSVPGNTNTVYATLP